MKHTKYVLINRDSKLYHTTATTLRVAEHMVQTGHAIGFAPVSQARIKRERIYVYHEDVYFRHVAEDAFVQTWNGKRCTAVVVSFDRSSGEGLVRLETGDVFTIYACNIRGKRTWYPHTACVYYTLGQTVAVFISAYMGGRLFVNGETPGTPDDKKWASLDQTRLAFKCDANGNAINGLFAHKP